MRVVCFIVVGPMLVAFSLLTAIYCAGAAAKSRDNHRWRWAYRIWRDASGKAWRWAWIELGGGSLESADSPCGEVPAELLRSSSRRK